MKDLIVVSYATHRDGLLDEYETSLQGAGIDFYLHPVTLDEGINSVTARWKFAYMMDMCLEFQEYRKIIFTDAWDVYFRGTKEELLTKMPEIPMVSAERNCWPQEFLADLFVSKSPWRYANPGMICGSPTLIIEWLSDLVKIGDLDAMEQAWFNRRIVEGHPIQLDWATSIFYVVSADKEDGLLKSICCEPFNSRYWTYPQFFHFSGKCSTEPFRAMLRTGNPLCVSA